MRNLPDGVIQQLRLFFIALQFFTRIPIPSWVGYDPAWMQHSTRYYPLVGVAVAAVTAAVYLVLALFLPQALAVLLSTAAGVYLTGAFHEDGFADVCDGFGGGYTRQRIIDIMKDSRIGAYGTIGIVLLLAIKCTALAHMPQATVVAALFAAHTLSRTLSAALIWRLDYAKDEGKAKPLGQHMSTPEFSIALATALFTLAVTGAGGWLSWGAIFIGAGLAVLATLWMSRLFIKGIGGFTGDCLGAVQQVSELMFYLGVLAAVSSGAMR